MSSSPFAPSLSRATRARGRSAAAASDLMAIVFLQFVYEDFLTMMASLLESDRASLPLARKEKLSPPTSSVSLMGLPSCLIAPFTASLRSAEALSALTPTMQSPLGVSAWALVISSVVG